ncbi:hypothetical protein Dimus_008424, partial [Dionaea muscipula]
LASILGIPGNNGICEYIKEVWEESKYTKPLEITRNFANDETIMEARRVKSVEMKPFQRFIHFLVMKNMVPLFGKRDTISYIDLIYMDHLIARRLGESGSDDQFFDAQVDVEEPMMEAQVALTFPSFTKRSRKSAEEQTLARVDPLGLSGHLQSTL